VRRVFDGAGGWVGVVRFGRDGVPITDGLDIYKIPAGKCIAPAFRRRTIATGDYIELGSPRWKDGETYDVASRFRAFAEPGDCT
jgi:hypothetical protein